MSCPFKENECEYPDCYIRWRGDSHCGWKLLKKRDIRSYNKARIVESLIFKSPYVNDNEAERERMVELFLRVRPKSKNLALII